MRIKKILIKYYLGFDYSLREISNKFYTHHFSLIKQVLKFTHDICQWSKPSAVSGAVNYGHSSSMQIREDADLFDFVRCVMEEIVIVIGLPRVFHVLKLFAALF